jgi:hypothetical protein
MTWTSNEVVATLVFLLPGFITAWIFYALSCFKKPSEFERVVQALIFGVLVQTLVLAIKIGALEVCRRYYFCLGNWSKDVQLFWSIAVAGTMGFLAAWLANSDRLHRIFRRIGLTKQTSYPTEWYRNFFTREGFVTLNLTDERRIMGELEEWPNESASGHFVLSRPHWLTESGVTDLPEVEAILIPASLVETVEFMREVTINDRKDSK